MYQQDRIFIGGTWQAPATDEKIRTIDPATEEVSGTAPAGSTADMDRAVAAARQAFDEGPWPRMTPAERAEILARAASFHRKRTEEMATLLTSEMGSPITQSVHAQIPVATDLIEYYAGLAGSFPWDETRSTYDEANADLTIAVHREPVGVVAAIVPWNGPQIVAMMKIAPALLAGCTAVLKPAPEACLNFDGLADAFADAGLPEGVLGIVPAGREVGEYLVCHDGVDKVSFTGSTAAGKRVGALCAERVRRVTLELGGKSAAIILDDANLDAVMPSLLGPMMFISGQACNALTRILAPAGRYEEVVDAVAAMIEATPFGDPRDPETFVGPLAAERQRDRVESYIELGRQEGARIVLGGGRPADHPKGWYVEKTLFADVDNDMRIAQEEIFGPVFAVIGYSDDAEAVRIANDSKYGLGGSIWTTDLARGTEMAERVRAGTVGVNAYTLDSAAPMGGFKESGLGRERGPEGIVPYTETKTLFLPRDTS
jgi:betaine-aldehyde dehydrogenase